MCNQLFKELPDHTILFNLLDSVCSTNEKDFLITEINYKQLKHANKIEGFYEYLTPFYFKSKQKYTQNKTYIGFLTIIRQLSKLFNIECSSKTIYGQGSYSRVLRMHINRHDWKDFYDVSDDVSDDVRYHDISNDKNSISLVKT